MVEEPGETEGPVWAVLVAVSAVVALLGVFVTLDALRGGTTGFTAGIADSMGGMFGG